MYFRDIISSSAVSLKTALKTNCMDGSNLQWYAVHTEIHENWPVYACNTDDIYKLYCMFLYCLPEKLMKFVFCPSCFPSKDCTVLQRLVRYIFCLRTGLIPQWNDKQ
jgi:hypothetical protein